LEGKGGAIDAHHGLIVAQRSVVQKTGEHFFARTGFSQQQNGGIAWSELAGTGLHIAEIRSLSYHQLMARRRHHFVEQPPYFLLPAAL